MQTYPGLERRGSQYYFRAIIPLQLRPLYLAEDGRPRRELRVSLNTTDRAEAIQLWHLRALAQKKEFQEKRKALAKQRESTRVKAVTKLSAQDTKGLMALWTQSVLQGDEQLRLEGLDDEDYETLGTRLASTEVELRAALARGRVEVILPALEGFLQLSELELQAPPALWRELAYAFLQTVVRTLEYQRHRHAGDIVDTEAVAPAASVYRVGTAPADALDFDSVFEIWSAGKKNRPPRTVAAYRQAWKEFSASADVKDVRAINLVRSLVLDSVNGRSSAQAGARTLLISSVRRPSANVRFLDYHQGARRHT